jgi:pimeloyl-ACP methyl ester carboxylesterase
MVSQIIDEALGFPHPQSPEAFRRRLEAWIPHDTLDRLHAITVPTLVVAGELDIVTPPRYGRVVAERIQGAELVVLPGEAHQPFQESPDAFNALVDEFGASVDARG